MKGLGFHVIAFGLMLAVAATIWWCATELCAQSPSAAVVLMVFAIGGIVLFVENTDYMEPELFKIWKPTNTKLPHQQFEDDLRKAKQRAADGNYDDDGSSDFFDDPENQRVLVPDNDYDDPFDDLPTGQDDDELMS